MRMVLGCALSMLMTQAACGDDIEGESLVGATCSSNGDCGVAGVCVSSRKEGLCSVKCESAGQLQQCPLGNYCDARTVETETETLQAMVLCFPACKSNADCRAGLACEDVTKGFGKVCVPDENQRDE